MESFGDGTGGVPGFADEEVDTSRPTRGARLKWVIVADRAVPVGQLANAVACVAASTGEAVRGLIGPAGEDAEGQPHPGLPWTGCSVLGATAQELAQVRLKALGGAGVLVVDMPAKAQETLVYDDYLGALAGTSAGDLGIRAISVVGPRNRVGKLVKGLGLLG